MVYYNYIAEMQFNNINFIYWDEYCKAWLQVTQEVYRPFYQLLYSSAASVMALGG